MTSSELEEALYLALAELPGGVTAMRQLAKGQTPTGQAAEAYHKALAEVIRGMPSPADAMEALTSLDFLARMRPHTGGRLLHRRPGEWWEAMAEWSEAVQRAIYGPLRPFRNLFVPDLLKEAGWFQALAAPAKVANGAFALVRDGGSALWRLTTAEGETLGFPLSWGRISPKGVELTASSETVGGAAVISVAVAYKRQGHIMKAAACEAINGTWSRWRVVDAPPAAETLARYGARVYHAPGVARVGHVLVEARTEPVFDYASQPVKAPWALRLTANGQPLTEVGRGNGWVFVFLPAAGELVLAHPDHYEIRLQPQPGQRGWTLQSIPGVTYPPARGGDVD